MQEIFFQGQVTTSFPWEQVINIIFFAIGFILGLVQLWQAQKYFLADQQNKVDQINQSITKISERLAVIEGTNLRLVDIDRTLTSIGATSNSLQDRLLGMVEKQFTKSERTEQVKADALDEIRGEIIKEFESSGVVTVDKLTNLEERINKVLNDLSFQVLSVNLVHTHDELQSNTEKGFSGQPLDENLKVLEIGEIKLALNRQNAWYNNEPVSLSHYEYLILRALMENAGNLLTIKFISETVFHDSSLSDEQKMLSAQTAIHKLHLKIDPDQKYLLYDSRKNGYVLHNQAAV